MIKLVVFDMAGTTVDEQNVVYKTLQKAINHGGIPVTLEDVLETGAGKEKKGEMTKTKQSAPPLAPSVRKPQRWVSRSRQRGGWGAW